jgi:hypothetical protein
METGIGCKFTDIDVNNFTRLTYAGISNVSPQTFIYRTQMAWLTPNGLITKPQTKDYTINVYNHWTKMRDLIVEYVKISEEQ